MRLGIATDHGGFELKEKLVVQLRDAGHEIVDFGAHRLTHDDDYPDFVTLLAQAVSEGKVDRGIAVCGSGVGASVCANKIKGVRAALIHDHEYHLFWRSDCGPRDGVGSGSGISRRRVQPSRAPSPTDRKSRLT
jgi:RpiB/LacA/LacB family sugar-phosphate isomerase